MVLNRFSPEVQAHLERMLPKLERNVHKNWNKKGHKNMIVLSPSASSEYSLCVVLYKNNNAESRDMFINEGVESALKPDHIKQCLVIAKNIDEPELAYNFIGLA